MSDIEMLTLVKQLPRSLILVYFTIERLFLLIEQIEIIS